MSFLQWLLTVYASVTRHIVRSLLAVLGIVLGIAAVVAMLAIGEGAQREAVRLIVEQGVDNILLTTEEPQKKKTEESENDEMRRKPRPNFSQQELDHILLFNNIAYGVSLSPVGTGLIANAGSKTDIPVVITESRLMDILRLRLIGGRFLHDFDKANPTMSCVLGKKAARKLFGFRNPVGQQISTVTTGLTVVGVVENPSKRLILKDLDPDNVCFVESAATSTFHIDPVSEAIYLRVKNIDDVPHTAGRIRTYLTHMRPEINFSVKAPFELLATTAKTQYLFTLVLTSIAAISLLVGGIGIMNIMLANIYERTREIGVRRALGARKLDIIFQFIGEASVLTLCGGVLGVLIGWGSATLAEVLSNQTIHAAITPGSVILALCVAITTGLLFGTYPAWKASRLDPLVALRHE